jgi:hypothetical protein
VLRSGRQFGRPEEYTGAELANLKQAGIDVHQLSGTPDSGGKAMLEYPKPDQVRPGLEKIIKQLKDDLAKPGANPIAAAADFQRMFVALHPFGDSNGRTSRIVMNRILAEFDLPPSILADQNHDVSVSPEQWRTEVAKGVARSKAFLNNNERELHSRPDHMGDSNIKAVAASPDKPVTIAGRPFDLGTDGMLYDPTGRPWMVSNGQVVPLAQLEHFVLSRRMIHMGQEAGTTKLKAITDETRALYDKLATNPAFGKDIVVRDDATVRKADARYQLAPEPEVGKMLADLTDVSLLDPAKMFRMNAHSKYGSPTTGNGSATSATLSKHGQVDLEFWYVEKGLRDSGQTELADQVRVNRAALFDLARKDMLANLDPTRVSPENPMGFRYKYEKMMFDTSPLRFETFDAAIAAIGDQKMTVWRGDYSFSRLLGMAPNNDIRQPDAKKVAKQRDDNSQLTNLYDDLNKLEGSAIGRQYICTTSDLALLSGTFASKRKSQQVNLSMVPAAIRERLLGWIAPHYPEGTTPADKEAGIKQAIERGETIVPTTDGGKEIRDAFGIPGTIIKVKVIDKDKGLVEIEAVRKAFEITMDKDGLLPGMYGAGGVSFEGEQEIHGLETVWPWQIKSAHAADKLKEEFPVVQGAAPATPTPQTPAQ